MSNPPTALGDYRGKLLKAARCVFHHAVKKARKSFGVFVVAFTFSACCSSQVGEVLDFAGAVSDLFRAHTNAVKKSKVQIGNRCS